jgi:type IV pilus assembly protein PilM
MLLGFVQNFFAPRANPIGVDFGSDSLRLAQVQWTDNECKLVAAACADVPQHVRHNSASRIEFFVETVRDLLAQGEFKGRQAVLGLPASCMSIQHLRMPKLDEEETRKALPWESRGKIPIDPSQALLRHLIAGEVYQDQDPKNEVIVMAAARDFVNGLIAASAKAKLDIVGMNVEPKALVDCFGHVYRRKNDQEVTNCFIDIGSTGTRVVIARGEHIFFARTIPIGGDVFTRAVAHEFHHGFDEAKLLRIKLCASAPALDEAREKHNFPPVKAPVLKLVADVKADADDGGESGGSGGGFALLDAALRASSSPAPAPAPAPRETHDGGADPAMQQAVSAGHDNAIALRVEKACREPLGKLVQELDLCRRYHEATFPSRPIERLVFVGGEARQRTLCMQIARELGVAAQLGDPMVRMGRVSDVGIESGIDRRQPQPAWSVAIGLSLGPLSAAGPGAAKSSRAAAAAGPAPSKPQRAQEQDASV